MNFLNNILSDITHLRQRPKYAQQLIMSYSLAILLSFGLLGGAWFGHRDWRERQRVRTIQAKLQTHRSPVKAVKAAIRPIDPETIARIATRKLVKRDRSNIDCGVMKCAALTYDDGPSNYTNELLDTLKSRQAVATFFVLGIEAVKRPAVIHRAVLERSEIGNHTWRHLNLTVVSDVEIASQLEQTDAAISITGGEKPRLVRPPFGQHDARVSAVVGRPLALWSIDPEDWRQRDPELIYQHVISNMHPGGVVLLHDIYPSSVQASSRIVDELQRQGYILVTVSELFGITDQNVGQYSNQVLKRR